MEKIHFVFRVEGNSFVGRKMCIIKGAVPQFCQRL